MRKGVLVISAVVSMVLAISAQAMAGVQLDKIRARGLLVGAVFNFDSAPFVIGDEQDVKGFDVDLIRAVAEKIGVQAKIVRLPWEGGITLAWDPKYNWDLFDIASCTITVRPSRSERCAFSVPYYSTGQMLLTRKDDGLRAQEDAQGKTIGILKGSTATEGASKLKAKALPFESYDLLVKALLDGIIVGAVMDGPVAQDWAEKHGELTILGDRLTVEDFAVAMPQGDDELKELVDQVVEESRQALTDTWLR